jgi:hypothetical protein
MHLIHFEHWLRSSLRTKVVPLPTVSSGRRPWGAVHLLYRLFAGSVTVCKIVALHVILNIEGVPHRISIGKTVEDEGDSHTQD